MSSPCIEPLRIGFMTGSERVIRKLALVAKHRTTRLTGIVYPDVYSLPYFLADRFEFIRDGRLVEAGRFDLIISELNRTERQLRNLRSIVSAGHTPVAIVPGPPELLSSVLDQTTLDLAQDALGGAAHIWAYSEAVRSFIDGFMGTPKARFIPWPFDYAATNAVGGRPRGSHERIDILLNVPLRFSGIAQGYPFVLKAVLTDLLREMPATQAARFRFHTFVYTKADRARFVSSGFADGLPVRIASKTSYVKFLRFLGRCDAVVNLTAGTILGRITFLSAALGRPGLFTDNAAINRMLYPGAVVPLLGTQELREALRGLLGGVAAGSVGDGFLPDREAARALGDFEANARIVQRMVGMEMGDLGTSNQQ